MFLMWWIMMLAMMLPSASPMILLFAAVNRKQRQRGGPYAATSAFAGGYLPGLGRLQCRCDYCSSPPASTS